MNGVHWDKKEQVAFPQKVNGKTIMGNSELPVATNKPLPGKIDPHVCPLCQHENGCGNIALSNGDCWCRSPDITFTEALFEQVPDEVKGLVCICKSCVTERGK